MITATFPEGKTTTTVTDDVWQYDHGQILQVEGVEVDGVAELDFAVSSSADRTTTYAVDKISETVMQVRIPDELLVNNDIRKDYNIFVWVFVINGNSGETTNQITIPIKSRPRRS